MKKKQHKALQEIKKRFNSGTSKAMKDSIKLYAANSSNIILSKHKSASLSSNKSKLSIVEGNIPELAKPDRNNSELAARKQPLAGALAQQSAKKQPLIGAPAQESLPSKLKSILKKSPSASVSKAKTNEMLVSKVDGKKKMKKEKSCNEKNEMNRDISSVKPPKVKKLAPLLPVKKKLESPYQSMAQHVAKAIPLAQSSAGRIQMKKGGSTKIQPITALLQKLDDIDDTRLRGAQVMSYLLAPHSISEFFGTYWEKKHLLIKRNNSNYMNGLFSTQIFDNVLRNDYVEYTKNLDVTSYSEGVRQTHNPVGRAYPPVVWDYFSNGCSLRMLNPQTFHKPVWQILAALQDFMGSFCGANVYLTPAETQGFAPHWDDIEAFVIQLEGKKRWRVYEPRKECEVLPRYSSLNLSQEEVGSPVLDVVLEEGDLLYFPRGFIHQGEATADTHSLHVTISSYQKNAWVDLFEKLLTPDALAHITPSCTALREGLPRGCFEYMGTMAAAISLNTVNQACGKKRSNNSSQQSLAATDVRAKKRKLFKEKVVSLMVERILSDATIDRAVDCLAQQFVRVALPLPITELEVVRTVSGDGESWGPKGVEGRVEIDPSTRVRLLGALAIRLE